MLGDNFSTQNLVASITLGWQLANSPPPAMSVFHQHGSGSDRMGLGQKE